MRWRSSVARQSPREFVPRQFDKPQPSWTSRDQKETFAELRREPITPTLKELPSLLSQLAPHWSTSGFVRSRFVRFGIPPGDVPRVINAFLRALKTNSVLATLEYPKDTLQRICYDLRDTDKPRDIDRALTRLFYEWASHPSSEPLLIPSVPLSTIQSIRELFRCANLSNFPSWFENTRAHAPRKVIMHVGPTNSGKTHNALRALAAAKRGCYAGPLRLLAHEIFARLNSGQIVPLGVDPTEPIEPDPNTNIDAGDVAVVVRKDGDPRYARPCNLVTGEERIVVEENSPLVSCTVEMVSTMFELDVMVIDEIQMLADPERGGAWTVAVVGANCRELHLCGEEAAVPLVKELLRNTGDEIIVNRYERLTPLRVADKHVEDLKGIQKGDCVVAFSRSTIFATKAMIEKETGLKCAIVYGGLPAEVRNEQAKLFNDPDSGYDVLVGSDAIGMGLNLKIKRIIFSAVRKSDGKKKVLISAPQIKQIAGRAGRFGLHADDDAGGVVTSLDAADLPIIREALALPPTPLLHARVRLMEDVRNLIIGALPPSSPSAVVAEVAQFVSKLDPCYVPEETDQEMLGATELEKAIHGGSVLSREELYYLMQAPVSWRHESAMKCMLKFVEMFQRDVRVDVKKALEEVGLLKSYETVVRVSKKEKPTRAEVRHAVNSLFELEILHKMLCAYMWLAWRLQIGFGDREVATEMKAETEKAIYWVLQATSGKGSVGLYSPYTKYPPNPTQPGAGGDGKGGRPWQRRQVDHSAPFDLFNAGNKRRSTGLHTPGRA
ncbi:P-loop containing nucleoside triphosphate hydrolase protein [Cristinia sonorae]|uniref:P-loop containing nucleoside triphosphate hydrolase protein n=1 Tax=Cristinia sonorae TaxID=1940300 RepID=A0A8K0UNT6_9AGAR|nr:P-loop containing nucleoside triphosphate hydrolase protein [Cristinia sonorae]